MGVFIHDIPSIEFFLILFMLILRGAALQAFIHKHDMTHESLTILFQWISKWVFGLVILATGLLIIALLANLQ